MTNKKQSEPQYSSLVKVFFYMVLVLATAVALPFVRVIIGSQADSVMPRNVVTSNVSQNSFTVVFITDKPVVGSLLYGVGDKIDLTALDGAGFNPTYTHLVTATNLNPGKTYNFLVRTDSSVSGAGGGKPFSVTLPPVSQTVPPTPKVAVGTLTNANVTGYFSYTVVLLKSGDRYLATRPDTTGGFLFTYTNFVGANGAYESLKGTTADVVYFRKSEAQQTFTLDLTNSKKAVGSKLQGGADLTVGESAAPVTQSIWDQIREFFMSLISRIKGQGATS